MSETINLDESPALLFHHACELGMEGIAAKRADAPYCSGRVQSWVKVKCIRRLALPIVGYVRQKGNSIARTGFTVTSAQSVRERLAPLHRSAASDSPRRRRTAQG
jgi:bifunctional non-homologous end joining protein LigD